MHHLKGNRCHEMRWARCYLPAGLADRSACVLNMGISHQQPPQPTPAFETSSQLCPDTPRPGGSDGLCHPATAPAAPEVPQRHPKPSGKTWGLAKPSPVNTRAADKPVWSRRLVVLSCLRRERKQDAWSSPSVGMGTGGEGAWWALFALTRGDCSGGRGGKKAGLFALR